MSPVSDGGRSVSDGPVPLMSVDVQVPHGGSDVDPSRPVDGCSPDEVVSSLASLFSSSEEQIDDFSEEALPSQSPSPSISSFTSPSGNCSKSILKDLPIVSSGPKVADQIVVNDIVGNCNGNVNNSNVGNDPMEANNVGNGPKVAHTSSGSKVHNGSSGFKSGIPKPSNKTRGQKASAPVSSDSEPDFKKRRTVSGGARAQSPAGNVRSSSPLPSAGTHKLLPAEAVSRPGRPH